MILLYIEGCNYEDFPVGGQLTFAKQLMKVFDEELALVGFVTEEFPLGSWQKKTINGKEYDYFALFHEEKSTKKPLIPRRLSVFFNLVRYRRKILQLKPDIVVTRSPEVGIPISKWGYQNFCYYFAGTSNPLSISRRWYGRMIARYFDRLFFPSLSNAKVILAAADEENINDAIQRSNGVLKDGDIIQFPTRINTEVFKPLDKLIERQKLNIDRELTVISTTGRLHWAKGWPLLLDAYRVFLITRPNSLFYFIGDGDERDAIEAYIQEHSLEGRVIILGFQNHASIASYINASDLFVMGSYKEGWATSLVEAKACGVPVCTTLFSSATSIIKEDIEGFVVKERCPKLYASKMLAALDIVINHERLEADIKKYSLKSLKTDFLNQFNTIQNSSLSNVK